MQSSFDRILRRMEGHTECVADDLKDEAAMRFDRLVQELVMPRQQRLKGIGMLLGDVAAAFDVGEEKGHRAAGS